MKRIIEPAREIPVINEVDIMVVGGGCTGTFAAIRAARLGAKVALIECANAFGGAATNAFVCVWHTLYDTRFKKQIISGLTEEMIERMKKIPHGLKLAMPSEAEKSVFRPHTYSNYHFNTEEMKIELDRMVMDAGVIPYLHTMYAAPYLEDGLLRGVLVENRSGRGAILGKYFIDATADGYLGEDMGMEVYYHESLQPATTGARVIGWDQLTDPHTILDRNKERIGCRPGWDDCFTDIPQLRNWFKSNISEDCSNADILTRAEINGRAQVREMLNILWEEDPGAKGLALIGLSSTIGIRETRQLRCSYQTTVDDICNGRHFDDAIAYCSYPVDIHHQHTKTSYRFLDGTEEIVEVGKESRFVRWREETEEMPTYWQLPYRSMVPENIGNLLICGRSIDTDKGALAAARVMICLNQTGEAAGVACYEALTTGKTVQTIDFSAMRKKMKQGGSIVLTD